MGGGADGLVHRDADLRAVRLHLGRQPAHRQGPRPGPLANPAHYFILVGLFLLFVAGCVAIMLPYEKPGPSAVRITRNWYAPVGGFLMAGCGLYALTGFPARRRLAPHLRPGRHAVGADPPDDDRRRRIFDDLRAAPRIRRASGDGRRRSDRTASGLKFVQYLGFGGVIIGLSVFQIEFDFGVPQFRQVFEPMLIAAAAAFGLVAARIMLGRGAAIIAALFAIALRGGRRAGRGSGARRADQLVRAVPRRGGRRRTARR